MGIIIAILIIVSVTYNVISAYSSEDDFDAFMHLLNVVIIIAIIFLVYKITYKEAIDDCLNNRNKYEKHYIINDSTVINSNRLKRR